MQLDQQDLDYIIQGLADKEIGTNVFNAINQANWSIATVQISSSQILNLHSQPVLLLGAPPMGQFYEVGFVDFIYNFLPVGGIPYTVGGGNLQINYNTNGTGICTHPDTGLLDQNQSVESFGTNNVAITPARNSGITLVPSLSFPTLGNGNLTLKIYYKVLS